MLGIRHQRNVNTKNKMKNGPFALQHPSQSVILLEHFYVFTYVFVDMLTQSYFVHVFHVCDHMCVHAQVHAYVCMWTVEVNVGCFPPSLSTILFETKSLTEPGAPQLGLLAIQ